MAPARRRRCCFLLLISVFVGLFLVSVLYAAQSSADPAEARRIQASDNARDAPDDGGSRELIPRMWVNPSDLPDPGPVSNADQRRGPGGPWDDGPYTYFCGVFNTGSPSSLRAGSLSLRVVNVTYRIAAGACLRVYCFDTSAIYACNDNAARNLTLPGFDIGWMAERLTQLCCDARHALSAQLFHPTEDWNTVVGYGNCRHAPDEPPSSYGVGNGGINGNCIAGASSGAISAPLPTATMSYG